MTEAVHTIEEAARLLRVPYRTARDAVFQERWPHVKVSARKRLMTDSDIAATLNLLRQPAKAPEESKGSSRASKRKVLSLLDAA